MCGKGNIVGDVFSGIEDMANAQMASAVSKGNAKTVRSVALAEAEKIKRQGKSNASTARAVAAENGVNVDVGAAAKIQDEHIGDAAYNASMTMSDANNQANQLLLQGKMKRNSYSMRSASSLVSAGATALGWK
ncbi:hypothetical protein [Acinetobacter sp. NIOH-H-8]|uniref:hypothetical protein n=1 Tax=Acinetobacter sp. NIOH-H-8 TaxID=3342120 RepID=UPI003986FA83